MPPTPKAFISYRRSDSSQAAQGLYIQLRERFGASRFFMDVSGTRIGDLWPVRIRRALEDATVVLAIIGPRWLRAADQFGRRRLDSPSDWVRTEIIEALHVGKPILPVLVGANSQLPPAEGLPEELLPLLDFKALRLRDDRWDADFRELTETLTSSHRFPMSLQPVVLPQPRVKVDPLSQEQLDKELSALPAWEPVETFVPGEYPKARHELRKAYRFRSFSRAIDFMNAAVEVIEAMPHHPRWENQWRTVTVYLSTWDIGNRITTLDVELARALDTLYDHKRK